jgi:predicted nucleotidyltransferase
MGSEDIAARASAQAPERLPSMWRRLRDALTPETTVRWAYLFGSGARGEPFRDLDVALMLADDARGGVALGRVAAHLEEAVPEVPVDVVDLRSAAPLLAGKIVREGQVLIDRDAQARRLWQTHANRRALDIEPWLERFERLRRKALEERARRW